MSHGINNLKAMLYVFSIMALLNGCGKSLYRTSEIKPGEADYPARNTNPTHLIQLIAVVPSTLSVQFNAGYVVSTSAGGSMASGTSCQREVGLAVTAPFSLSLPLQVIRDGELVKGTIEIDRFLPGRCNWNFQSLGYGLDIAWPQGGDLADYNNRSDMGEHIHLNVWCRKIPKPFDLKFPEECSTLSMFRDLVARPEFMASIPVDERGNDFPASIGSKTLSITVQFHDIDAMPNAHSPPH